jgi:hypothetical protein
MTVWPQHSVSRWLVDRLARDFPTSLLLRHPLFAWWQHYEDEFSLWDAQRLYNAIRSYYEHGEDADWRWWTQPTAPHLKDDMFPAPGEWLLTYLGRRDLWRRGGARKYLLEVEARERARKERAREDSRTLHRDIAKEGRRHFADAIRDDPLAGTRKWVHTVPIDLTEVSDGTSKDNG